TTGGGFRYADFVVDEARGRLIGVREDHTDAEQEPVNTVTEISYSGAVTDNGRVLVAGAGFYSSPRLSPDGLYLAWVSWNHPDMPWDGTELWLARLDTEGLPVEPMLIAGG